MILVGLVFARYVELSQCPFAGCPSTDWCERHFLYSEVSTTELCSHKMLEKQQVFFFFMKLNLTLCRQVHTWSSATSLPHFSVQEWNMLPSPLRCPGSIKQRQNGGSVSARWETHALVGCAESAPAPKGSNSQIPRRNEQQREGRLRSLRARASNFQGCSVSRC